VALGCLLAVVGLFGLDGLLFRTGLYTSWLEPDSSTGEFELILWREQQAQKQNGDNLVVTLGDSRFAFYPRVCNQLTADTGYVFRSAGVAGSDMRSWYYMLRDLDPTGQRYRAIVFGVNDYDDEDESFNPYDDLRPLHYIAARLRWADAIEFAGSFESRQLQWEAFRAALLKGFILQADLHAFLSHPLKRIQYVQLCHRGFPQWTYDYVESKATMTGLAVDWSSLQAAFPPNFESEQRETTQNALLRKPIPQTGRLARFRREWFGKIVDRYRGSRTRIIFLRLPRGPVVRPDGLVEKKSASIRELARRPNVMLAGEHAFDSLERPELFKDALHLNDEGCSRFSKMMAGEIARMLGK
jgi:lysophospholipase L1-like esterase